MRLAFLVSSAPHPRPIPPNSTPMSYSFLDTSPDKPDSPTFAEPAKKIRHTRSFSKFLFGGSGRSRDDKPAAVPQSQPQPPQQQQPQQQAQIQTQREAQRRLSRAPAKSLQSKRQTIYTDSNIPVPTSLSKPQPQVIETRPSLQVSTSPSNPNAALQPTTPTRPSRPEYNVFTDDSEPLLPPPTVPVRAERQKLPRINPDAAVRTRGDSTSSTASFSTNGPPTPGDSSPLVGSVSFPTIASSPNGSSPIRTSPLNPLKSALSKSSTDVSAVGLSDAQVRSSRRQTTTSTPGKKSLSQSIDLGVPSLPHPYGPYSNARTLNPPQRQASEPSPSTASRTPMTTTSESASASTSSQSQSHSKSQTESQASESPSIADLREALAVQKQKNANLSASLREAELEKLKRDQRIAALEKEANQRKQELEGLRWLVMNVNTGRPNLKRMKSMPSMGEGSPTGSSGSGASTLKLPQESSSSSSTQPDRSPVSSRSESGAQSRAQSTSRSRERDQMDPSSSSATTPSSTTSVTRQRSNTIASTQRSPLATKAGLGIEPMPRMGSNMSLNSALSASTVSGEQSASAPTAAAGVGSPFSVSPLRLAANSSSDKLSQLTQINTSLTKQPSLSSLQSALSQSTTQSTTQSTPLSLSSAPRLSSSMFPRSVGGSIDLLPTRGLASMGMAISPGAMPEKTERAKKRKTNVSIDQLSALRAELGKLGLAGA